jgi:hypothetical protein
VFLVPISVGMFIPLLPIPQGCVVVETEPVPHFCSEDIIPNSVQPDDIP